MYVPQKSSPAVTVMVLVNVGAEFERANENGISHFLEHMFFKGTLRRPRPIDITLELDSLGARYNAFTSREYTGYYVKSAKAHFDKVSDVLFDMILNSTFKEDDIERERGVIIEEINMYRDLPRDRVADIFNEMLYGDQPAGRDTLGTKETVSGFTRRNFLSYKKRHYTPEKMLVVVSGGVDEKKAEQAVSEFSAFLEGGKVAKKPSVRYKQSEPRLALEYKKTDQTHLVLGTETVAIDHDDAPALRVLNSVLDGGMSGRIFHKLRDEMGVAYYAGSSTYFFSDHGAFAAAAGVTTSRAVEVVEVFLDELRRLREEPVSKEELKKAKDYYVGNLLLSLETSDALARFYGFQEILGKTPKSLEERKAEIQSVTSEDIERVANKYLIPSRMNLAVVGAHKGKKAFLKVLGQ